MRTFLIYNSLYIKYSCPNLNRKSKNLDVIIIYSADQYSIEKVDLLICNVHSCQHMRYS